MKYSSTNQIFHRYFECSLNTNTHYRLRFEPSAEPISPYNKFWQLYIEESQDNRNTWERLPLKLTYWSYLLLWTSAQPEWPPEIPVNMGCDSNKVWFDYEDELDEQRWGRMPSAWRATYFKSHGRWKLQHLRYLT